MRTYVRSSEVEGVVRIVIFLNSRRCWDPHFFVRGLLHRRAGPGCIEVPSRARGGKSTDYFTRVVRRLPSCRRVASELPALDS